MASNSKYAEWVKEALTSEIKERRAAGREIPVDLRANEETLRAALDADDISNGDFNSSDEEPQKSSSLASKSDSTEDLSKPAEPHVPPVVTARNAGLPVELGNQLSLVAAEPTQPTHPLEKEWEGSGLYKNREDGRVYQMVHRADDTHDKPVKCRIPKQASGHPGLFWEGSSADFIKLFEKV